MPAPSKPWVNILDTAVDPDSPGDAPLFGAIQGDLVHVRETVYDPALHTPQKAHNHDGVNSAAVEIGANFLRNGSFEEGEGGWTFTDFTGGSHATNAANDMHGAQAIAFTSTVLANGGGEALQNEFVATAGSKYYGAEVHAKASVANVSSKAEIIWYDDAKVQISATPIYSDTNTPTAATNKSGVFQAPATARYRKIKLTGGVPGTGTAIGTIYLDGVLFTDLPYLSVREEFVAPAAVSQSKLKTAQSTVSTISDQVLLTLPGGEYGFYPQIRASSTAGTRMNASIGANLESGTPAINMLSGASWGTTFLTRIGLGVASSATAVAQQRHIQASPDWDLGDGPIPLFVFVEVDSVGNPVNICVSPDPVWAYQGPTWATRRPAKYVRDPLAVDSYASGLRVYARQPAVLVEHGSIKAAIAAGLTMAHILDRLVTDPIEEFEITQAIKNRDMSEVAPFGNVAPGNAVVMLDPVSPLMQRLACIHDCGDDSESVDSLLRAKYVTFGNTAIARASPIGIMPVSARLV